MRDLGARARFRTLAQDAGFGPFRGGLGTGGVLVPNGSHRRGLGVLRLLRSAYFVLPGVEAPSLMHAGFGSSWGMVAVNGIGMSTGTPAMNQRAV